MISSDLFRVAYILKTLGISMKMYMLEELLKESNEDESEILDKKIRSTKTNYISNNYYNKSYNNWRPQGQIITTLYDHKTIPIEKLLPLDNSHFCSFDNKGNAILYNVKISEEDEILIKKDWEYFRNNDKDEILYKNNVCCLDNLSFALSLGKKLYQYNAHISPKTNDFSIKLCSTKDNSNISCIKTIGICSKENQKILYCTEKGSINLYDSRAKGNNALDLIIPKEKGMMICISESFENNQYLIGTLDGNLLKYDLRINSLVKDFQYSNDNPIIGINIYKMSKAYEYDFNFFNKNNQYLILWTGAEEHEIGLFNYSDLNCDLLLKINIQSNGNHELNPLEIDIPYLESNINNKNEINNIENNLNNNIKQKFKSLNKYTYLYNNNIIKRFFTSQIKDKQYEITSHKLSNLTNLYGNPNTVQCVLSPFSECSFSQNNYSYYNAPYIISAGNDKVIRYWDISKDNLNVNYSKKSYIINAPNNINYCSFTKGFFDKTNILQSNEIYNAKKAKISMSGLSEFQNFNGILYHSSIQNEFDENDNDLKYCTKISDPSHKSIISDLLPLSLSGNYEPINLLVSSSWDGTIKLWK